MATTFNIALLVILVAMAISLPYLLLWLAEGNTFFTIVPEGTSKAIIRGRSGKAAFDHIVMNFEGYHLNDPRKRWFDKKIPKWEVVKDLPGIRYDDRGFLTKWLGVHYVGLPPFRSVYKYEFAWKEMRMDDDGNDEVWPRKETTDFIYNTTFPYILDIKATETEEGIPVNVRIQASQRCVNPYRALFDTENWGQTVGGSLIGCARNFVGSKTYSNLTSESKKRANGTLDVGDGERLSSTARAMNDRFPDGTEGLIARYGIAADGIDILEVQLAVSEEEKDKILADTLARYRADNNAYTLRTEGAAKADAIRAEGTAEADVITAKGNAEAGVIEKKGEAKAKALAARLLAWDNGGPLSAIIAQTEAMGSKGPGRTVVWANNPFVNAIPGLPKVFDDLGFKTIDDVKAYFQKEFGFTANSTNTEKRA